MTLSLPVACCLYVESLARCLKVETQPGSCRTVIGICYASVEEEKEKEKMAKRNENSITTGIKKMKL